MINKINTVISMTLELMEFPHKAGVMRIITAMRIMITPRYFFKSFIFDKFYFLQNKHNYVGNKTFLPHFF